MFGMGFTEILLIAVMAIIFIGPDKLPSMLVDIAKFFRSVKNTIGTVKDSLEEELNVSEIQKEALAYKKELLSATEDLNQVTDIKNDIVTGLTSLDDDILSTDDEAEKSPKAAKEPETVTFAKKQKKVKKVNDDKKPKKEDEIDV